MKKGKLLAIFTSLLAMGALAGCSLDNIPAGDSTTITPVPSTIIPTPSDAKSSPSSTSTTIIPSPSTISSSDKSTFTVSFNGKIVPSQTVNKGECARKPTDPTMDGYTFIGWYNGDELYDFSKPVESDISLNPEWELIDYEITYELNGGIVPEGVTLPTTYNFETPEYKLPNLTKEDYDFIGWIKDGETTVPASDYIEYPNHFGNIKYVANFKPHDYLADQLSNFKYRIEDDKIIIESLINKNVEELVIPEGVYGIDPAAFIENEHIKKVILPESLEYIGLYAFDNCINLTDINIPSKLTTLDSTFERCTSLESIDISNVDTLTGNVFGYCTSLKNIKFSNNIKEIGGYIVPGCTSLKEITIPGTIDRIDRFAFENCPIEKATIPSNAIESIAFSSKIENINNVLKEVIITDGTSIPNASFYRCTALSKVTLPDTITYIGNNAFYKCSLVHIDLPSSLTTIGNNAFKDCKFDNLIIPNTITKIGNNAFTSIENIYYDGSIADWANIDYDAMEYESLIYSNPMQFTNNFYLLDENGSIDFNDNKYRLLEEITPDDNLTEIKPYAFYKCKSLKKISLGDNITTIGDFAFNNCPLLKEIIVPNANTIESHAFYNNVIEKATIKAEFACLMQGNTIKEIIVPSGELIYGLYGSKSLTKVTLPNTITTIDNGTFMECTSLVDINLPDSIITIGQSAFYGCSSIKKIEVPTNTKTIRDMAFYSCNSLKELSIPGNVEYLGGSIIYNSPIEKMTASPAVFEHLYAYVADNTLKEAIITSGEKILDYTFASCSNLTTVTLPNTVTTIGKGAFSHCTKLTNFILPNTVTTIEQYAFSSCTNLKKIEFSKNITSIGDNAFNHLEETYYDGNIGDWTKISFDNSNVLKTSKLYLLDENGSNEFNNKKYSFVENLVIDSSTTEIKDYAFYGYKHFKSVTIPASVTKIENNAFGEQTIEKITIENPDIECDSFKIKIIEADIPASLISLMTLANIRKLVITSGDAIDFSNYNFFELHTLVIPSDTTSIVGEIKARKLKEIYNLSSLNIEKGSTEYGSVGRTAEVIHTSLAETSILEYDDNYAYMHIGTEYYLFDCYGLEKITTLPESFTFNNTTVNSYNIYYRAFANASSIGSLEELTIPSSVKTIGERAFYDCTSIRKVVINEGVTKIGSYAFEDIYYLNTVILPDSLKNIGEGAFAECPNLLSITIPKNVTTIGYAIFSRSYKLREIYNLSSVSLTQDILGQGACDNVVAIHNSLSDQSILVTDGNYTFYYFNNTGYYISYAGEIDYDKRITTCTLPDSFTYNNTIVTNYVIDSYAFYRQYYMDTLVIPSSVSEIKENAFFDTSIKSITIEDKDTIINGDIFKDNYLVSVAIPVELVSSVHTVNLRNIEITSGDEIISVSFTSCSNLASVTLHSGIKKIGELAFEGCSSLDTLIFKGTMAEWDSVIKGDNWVSTAIFTKVICSDGEVNI